MEIQVGTISGFGLRLLAAFLGLMALTGREVFVGGRDGGYVTAGVDPEWWPMSHPQQGRNPDFIGIFVRPNGRHEVTAPTGRWEYNPDSHMWESVEGSKTPPEWVPRQ